MKWKNLAENKCPSCNADFSKATSWQGGKIYCGCGFKISEKRMTEIVCSMNTKLAQKMNNPPVDYSIYEIL